MRGMEFVGEGMECSFSMSEQPKLGHNLRMHETSLEFSQFF
jgi:hypothetical protein